jgi:GTP-binding protein
LNTQPSFAADARQIERLFSSSVKFSRGVRSAADYPPLAFPEFCFAGRSNVGKSSLINAIFGQKLARASCTPGRTQELNYFNIGDRLYMVDLPGYGYAVASKQKISAWNRLMSDFFQTRTTLRRVFILIDGRHGVKTIDQEMFDGLLSCNIPFQLVFTKIDKVKKTELEGYLRIATAIAETYPNAVLPVIQTSAEKKIGLDGVRASITSVALEGLNSEEG